ncbi:CAP-Gly domain-containing linker protein 3 [Terrapene carolina triunguis]|uniref:CAP-Gly domain-containing linker protein 3 n=1 Tax=Terrapene triunguis TaxID=2587831 RepID=UPI0011566D82|nr:CAP-Gly domain-containing linker protein 3 [Terrapene carolina triunguis]
MCVAKRRCCPQQIVLTFIKGAVVPLGYLGSLRCAALRWAFTFFDPNDPACQEILYDPKTTVPELFAIIRQWVPQVQHKIDVIGSEILKRGCHVNDRDGLTDMTLLHYACKAGAHGVVLNSTCSDFNHGTALHIAASNLCLGAVKCLLEHGANPAVRNSKGQVPADVVPDPMDMTLDKAEAAMVAKELKQLLLDAVPLSCNLPKVTLPNYDNIPGNLMLTSLGLKLGERVVVDGQKGYWFGIELDKPTGKHDGSVFGVRYFSCSPKHGVFAPPSRVQRIGGPKDSQGDSSSVKKVHQVTMSQPKRNFTAVRTPKDITSENSISRLLFCCWFPWMLRAEMQS